MLFFFGFFCWRGGGVFIWSFCGDSFHCLCDSPKPIEGFVDDYAFVIRGLLDLYEASLDARWLEWCRDLQAKQDQLFWDRDGGGYYSSQDGDAFIVLRMKEGVFPVCTEDEGREVCSVFVLRMKGGVFCVYAQDEGRFVLCLC